jgi:hypothetical protein
MQGFFEEFCDVVKVVIIQKWFSQIWLHTRYENRANQESFYILGYLLEHIVKTWQFGKKIILWNLTNLGFFFP